MQHSLLLGFHLFFFFKFGAIPIINKAENLWPLKACGFSMIITLESHLRYSLHLILPVIHSASHCLLSYFYSTYHALKIFFGIIVSYLSVHRTGGQFPMKPVNFKLQSPCLGWGPCECWELLGAVERSGWRGEGRLQSGSFSV